MNHIVHFSSPNKRPPTNQLLENFDQRMVEFRCKNCNKFPSNDTLPTVYYQNYFQTLILDLVWPNGLYFQRLPKKNMTIKTPVFEELMGLKYKKLKKRLKLQLQKMRNLNEQKKAKTSKIGLRQLPYYFVPCLRAVLILFCDVLTD